MSLAAALSVQGAARAFFDACFGAPYRLILFIFGLEQPMRHFAGLGF